MIFCTASIECFIFELKLRAHVTLPHFKYGALNKSDSNLDQNDLINHLNVFALFPVPRRLISTHIPFSIILNVFSYIRLLNKETFLKC